ncbi:hypothetical protein TNCV_1558921 [Trichonephila clavipes]|nr:hypothetical protein TNCV_1558921 [Trichonephila clavipes]
MLRVGKTRPLPGNSIFGSIDERKTSSWRASTHHGVQQGRQCAGHLENQARRFPGIHPEYSDTATCPILRKDIQMWSRASYLSCPSTNLTRGLAAQWLFRAPPCHKGTMHLQTSMISLGFELRPWDIVVRVTNY